MLDEDTQDAIVYSILKNDSFFLVRKKQLIFKLIEDGHVTKELALEVCRRTADHFHARQNATIKDFDSVSVFILDKTKVP
jgi:hypothetical protein